MKVVLLFALALVVSVGVAFGQYKVPQSVVGTGGDNAGSANFGIRGTLGQPAIGPVGSTGYNSLGGYWYNPGTTVTAIGKSDEPVPARFSLEQSYPNPFNPTTTIQFSLPAPSLVTLRIYDVAGRLVTTLLNGELPAGVHREVWDASGHTSGVYFYRITTPSFVETRRLVLLK
jgi:hypothetical protein